MDQLDQLLTVKPTHLKISYEALAAPTSWVINSFTQNEPGKTPAYEQHPSDALRAYMIRHYKVKPDDPYALGIGEGVDIGLKFAVAILTHGLDFEKIREDGRQAVKEIFIPNNEEWVSK